MADETVTTDTSNGTEATVETEATDAAKPEFTENEKKLYARAKKAEAELKALKSQPAKPAELPQPQKGDVSDIERFYAVKELKEDEFLKLTTDAKDLGVDPIKYIRSDAGKARLESIRNVERAKETTPATGTRSPIYQKFSEQELKDLPISELEKILPR